MPALGVGSTSCWLTCYPVGMTCCLADRQGQNGRGTPPPTTLPRSPSRPAPRAVHSTAHKQSAGRTTADSPPPAMMDSTGINHRKVTALQVGDSTQIGHQYLWEPHRIRKCSAF